MGPNLTNLAFSFLVDFFQSFASGSSFDQLWPQLQDRMITLSQAVILLGSSVGSLIETSIGDIKEVMVEVGSIQDALGVGKDLTDVPLRFCWEGIRFVNQSFSELSALTLPLLNVKMNEKNLLRDMATIGVGVLTLEHRFKGLEVLLRTIESEYMSHFVRLNTLYPFGSGGAGN